MHSTLFIVSALGAVALAVGCGSVTDDVFGVEPGAGGVGGEGGHDDLGGHGGRGGTGIGGAGGAAGGCAVECSTISPPLCYVAACNEGQHPGPVGICVIVAAPTGTRCNDGLFCTVDDVCDNGTCAGEPNTCGLSPPPCELVLCDEGSRSCSFDPANEGAPCTPGSLCQVNGMCVGGVCQGQPLDCSAAPVDDECDVAVCNLGNGLCQSQPDPSKNGQSCIEGSDVCQVNEVCSNGDCVGGTPKDCSALTAPCQEGTCHPVTGQCIAVATPGVACVVAADQCNTGECDASATCNPVPVANGTLCNDSNTCTTGDSCTAGICGGTSDPNCTAIFTETFDGVCPNGWVLGGDWQCGAPSIVGPATAYSGTQCLGTILGGLYSNNQAYGVAVADSPSISLVGAVNPSVQFRAYVHTEGSVFDGFNLKVSTDGGVNHTLVSAVMPSYNLTILGQPAWGGPQQASGWQLFTADLSAFAGQSVKLRFDFRSDGSIINPGVYIDDVIVAD